MPKEAIKYLQLKLFSKIDFTDSRLIELIKRCPSSKKYSENVQEINISSDNSRQILELIAHYDNGFFLPEKCDAYEPIREKFDPNNLSAPIRWLSQPGSAVYLKKIKPFKYEGVIENQRFAPIWEDGNNILIPKTQEPYYLGYIWLHIDEKLLKLKSQDYLFDFFNALFENIDAEYGYIKNSESEIVLEKGILNKAEDN